ncbi:hypothetical protein CCHL11_02281 [Colletotrichum chlorophyti]|uniref:2EXR domain-containing protein n=1 Tax=Colletotrichum chlorophyti TaxID=708187 RepID=A0A1Q8S5S0_9PEZI|nr:hypothetical protein CCHL11_02281 [Colletotrichum chlorophyti]
MDQMCELALDSAEWLSTFARAFPAKTYLKKPSQVATAGSLQQKQLNAHVHADSLPLPEDNRSLSSSPVALRTFTRFTDLPAELRLKIWDQAVAGPLMHVFDVCFPSWRGNGRSKRAFQDVDEGISEENHKRWTKYSESAFLDSVEVGPAELTRRTEVARHAYDPSGYKLRRSQRLACTEALAAAAKRLGGRNMNTVYLPGRREKVEYERDKDVLFLRFRDGGALKDLCHGVLLGEFNASGAGRLNGLLEGPWSVEMAQTLHDACRIALDVTETWVAATVGSVLLEEVAYLAYCLQHDLQVLYLVDYCHRRCTRCNRQEDGLPSQLHTRGELYQRLHRVADEAMTRSPDVIHGVGKTYYEVFDLEGLGWSEEHPTYIFARAIDETVRSQQADTGARSFQGVRVLVVEDEVVEGVDTTTLVDCNPSAAPDSRADQLANMTWRWWG